MTTPGDPEGASQEGMLAQMDERPDSLLFTPGPLTTSQAVKNAMLHDVGSRESVFLAVVREVRARLLGLYGLSSASGWEAIPLQGSGTAAVEAMLSTAVPPHGRLLVIANGAYGQRLARIADVHRIACHVMTTSETLPVDPDAVREILRSDEALTHVALVHDETSTGMLNPLAVVGQHVREARRILLVDAMSSFGALPIDFDTAGIDFLAASANKCLHGAPGLAFVIARKSRLEQLDDQPRTLSLDLLAQWRRFEDDGQFRFTPPTHVVLALHQALRELEDEGGVAARGARYRIHNQAIRHGMESLGFRSLLREEDASSVIGAFRWPDWQTFDFQIFHRRLSERGFVIYPGMSSETPTFRIGNIGHLSSDHVAALLVAIESVVDEMRAAGTAS